MVLFPGRFTSLRSLPVESPVILIDAVNGISPSTYRNTATLLWGNYYSFVPSNRIDFINIPLTPTSTGITFVMKFRFTGSTNADYESLLCFNRVGDPVSWNSNQTDANTIFMGRVQFRDQVSISFSGASSITTLDILNSPNTGTLTRGTDYILAVRWTGNTTTAGPAYTVSRWITTGSSLSGVAKSDTTYTSARSPADGTYSLLGIGHQNQRGGYGFMTGFIYYMYVYNQALTDSQISLF